MYLGCDLGTFHPLPEAERKDARWKIFGITDDVFLVVNVNRNQWRKDMVRTMLGFKRFKERYSGKTLLYLHSKVLDMGGDLRTQATACGLDLRRDIMFTPDSFSELTGIDGAELNKIYACADVVVSTALGEGWGMSTTEAFATRTPFLGPRNTVFPELVGENEERGWLAKCKGYAVSYGFDDHLRPTTDVESFASKLLRIAEGDRVEEKTQAAYEWVRNNTWKEVGKKWINLIEEVLSG